MDIVIGLIGAKGAGKTTAFEAIKSVVHVQEITLAAKLKDVCSTYLHVDREAFDAPSLKEKDLETPVFLTGPLITEMFRAYGLYPDYDKFIRPHIGKVLYTPRLVAQYVGTEVLRNFHPDIHCDSAAKGIHAQVGVVTDMRFPNEYDYFDKGNWAFYSIYIQNVGAEIKASQDTHASEAHLQILARRATQLLPNNSSLKEFQDSVSLYVRSLLK